MLSVLAPSKSAAVQMRIRIPPLFRRRTTAPTNPNVSFVVKLALASDLGPGWTEDMANWPIVYKSYTSEDAFSEALKAIATTDIVVTPNGIVAHTLTLQPCASPASNGNEDRHVVQHWELPCGQWTFVGVFDGAYDDVPSACYRDLSSRRDTGHSGHETSEHTAQCLPSLIRSHLQSVLTENPKATPNSIGDALSNAVQVFDKSLEDDLKAVLPEHFEDLGDEELQAAINDQASGGRVYTKMVRCMRGACSVIAIIDPAKENLWIVNLGDCEAGQYLIWPRIDMKLTHMVSASPWREGIVRRSQSVYLNFNTQCYDRR